MGRTGKNQAKRASSSLKRGRSDRVDRKNSEKGLCASGERWHVLSFRKHSHLPAARAHAPRSFVFTHPPPQRYTEPSRNWLGHTPLLTHPTPGWDVTPGGSARGPTRPRSRPHSAHPGPQLPVRNPLGSLPQLTSPLHSLQHTPNTLVYLRYINIAKRRTKISGYERKLPDPCPQTLTRSLGRAPVDRVRNTPLRWGETDCGR